MQSSASALRIWTLITALCAALLGCALLRGAAPADHQGQTALEPDAATQTAESFMLNQPVDLEKIQVDYLYRSDLITILYPLYGSILDDFTIITITNTNPSLVRLKVLSEVQGYTDLSMDTVTVAGNETLEVRQNPRLISSKIENLNVQQPAQFHLRVAALQQGVEKMLLEETGETLVLARRDFPWGIPGMSEAEIFELLAAMVTPNDPKVEELLRAAADYTESGSMWGGYSGVEGDEDGKVWERLEAIWRAADEIYNLTYVSTLVTYAPGDIQRIRLPRETLEQHAGNCIDLSLLFASAAEAIRLEVAIIGIPGHAFIGVRTDQVGDRYYFIETTLIGQSSFERAVEMGNDEWQEVGEAIENNEPHYNWVTIADAREKGILPLPWP
ncbi:MAG: hypothetical protein DDG59_05685 [Anaerolineae bacterium]|jgi:hypothetical protein|nr:MAG: hypothetical protein DDG59_05685 [Anaerolineae bacterium]